MKPRSALMNAHADHCLLMTDRIRRTFVWLGEALSLKQRFSE